MNSPLVSVIIPIYNAEKYLEDTINSVLAQTYSHWELILVDDGSTDNSLTICQQLQTEKTKIIQQENGGVSAALNTGISQSQGEYVAFLDADDLWLAEKLTKHIAHLESNPDVGVSFSPSAFIDEQGNSLNGKTNPKLKHITPVDLFRGNPLGNGSSAVVRRQTLEEIKFSDRPGGGDDLKVTLNPQPHVLVSPHQDLSQIYSGNPKINGDRECYFDEQIHASQDIEYIIRISLKTNWKIEGIPETLTLYRILSQSNSSNWLKKFQDWETLLTRTSRYAPEVVEKWGNMGKAYQLRYLARKAIRTSTDKTLAKTLINRSLKTYGRILLEEPIPTIKVILAAYLLLLSRDNSR